MLEEGKGETKAKRERCSRCRRPKVVCICSAFQWIDNPLPIIVLQHPTEEKKPFGTCKIVENCLSACSIFVGETFETNEAFQDLLNQSAFQTFLVFPSEEDPAMTINLRTQAVAMENGIAPQNIRLLFIDGTWRKAKKIFYANPFLQALPRVSFRQVKSSEYQIRRSSVKDSLSLVEACYYSLSALDKKTHYEPLMTAFRLMVKKQKAFHHQG